MQSYRRAFHSTRMSTHSQSRVIVGSLVCESGPTITDNKHAVQVLNDYFSSVFTKEIMSTMPEAWRMFMGDDSPRKKVTITETGQSR